MARLYIEAGKLVARYLELRGIGQTAVAHLLTQDLGQRGIDQRITQPHVSDHTRGKRWNFDLPGAYIRVLGIPEDEMTAAFGWSNPKGDREQQSGPRAVTHADVVKADPSLSKAAKRHLINQYKLLQQLPSEPEGGPTRSSDRPRSSRKSAR